MFWYGFSPLFYVNKNIILQALSQWLHSNDPSRVSFLHWYWFSPAWILICALNNKHLHNVCNDRLYIYYVFSFYISHCIHTRNTREFLSQWLHLYAFYNSFRQCVSSNDGSDDSGLKCLVTSPALIWLLFRVNLGMTWKTILQLEIAVTIFALTWLPSSMQTCVYISRKPCHNNNIDMASPHIGFFTC